MSHIALQRMVVRMMFDSHFCNSVYQNSAIARETADLSAEECSWLVEPDPRSYSADPHFCARSLHSLLTEFPVTGAIALRSRGELERFFSSRVLHRAIQDGTSLVLAFGRWIAKEQRIRKAECKASNQVELSMAKLRRPQTGMHDHPISLAPHVSTISVFRGTLALYQQLLAQLAGKNSDLATTALDPEFRLSLPALEAGTEHLLIERKADGQMAMEKLPDGLAAMLRLADRGCTVNELLECAHAMGAEGNEAQEIVDELYSDGLLADTRNP